jgi:hypothetical protein
LRRIGNNVFCVFQPRRYSYEAGPHTRAGGALRLEDAVRYARRVLHERQRVAEADGEDAKLERLEEAPRRFAARVWNLRGFTPRSNPYQLSL